MKKNFTIFFFSLILSSCAVQESHEDILKSTKISEIEDYLSKAHPEDPKKHILKSKLIALKNSEWTKGAAYAKPMEVRPVISEIPLNIKNKGSNESEEFKNLLNETSASHKEKTVKLLNTMLDQNINSKEAILLFKNNSDCNLVLRINGEKFYNLAVPSHNENFIVLEKGNYSITSDVCDVKYFSTKNIIKIYRLQLEIHR